MKKLICAILAVCLLFAAAGCKQETAVPDAAKPTEEASVADMSIKPTPTPETTPTFDPISRTEEFLDAVLKLEPFECVGKTFEEMDKLLAGLDIINYPEGDRCYFRYADMPDCWFVYDSEQPAKWDFNTEEVPIKTALKDMQPDDKVCGVAFRVQDAGMAEENVGLQMIETIVGEVQKDEQTGELVYRFSYKGYDFAIYPGETVAIIGTTFVCAIKAEPAA